MLGAPVAFNWAFGRFQSRFPYRKQFLIFSLSGGFAGIAYTD
jgi:hypothetical protein